MAQVAEPASVRGIDVFSSVFSRSSLSYRKRDNKRVKLSADPTFSKEKLRQGLQPLLGIGIEDGAQYVYGIDCPTAEGEPFRIPISKCEPMHTVRRSNKTDYLQWRLSTRKAGIWRWIIYWQKEMSIDFLSKAIAEVLDDQLRQCVKSTYKGCYRPDVAAHLDFWVQHIFAGIVEICQETLGPTDQGPERKENDKLELGDLKRWHDIALTCLGDLRVEELYDTIVDCDKDVNGIDDLRRFITSPASRSYLTTHFSEALSSRLLHPGASTVEILHHYISIIRAFRLLDPKGVLLDRVARRVRKYLKDRDDTIKVMVGGLLSDPFDSTGQPIPYDAESLTEIALELSRRDETSDEDDAELDWDNMDWVPDPIDAAPDYMKSKNTDVIGSLTSLFESKDIFVKELQTTLADRLLKNKPDFKLEISVVEHLKTRFGHSALQGCEVMLRDVSESRNVNEIVLKEQSTITPVQNAEERPELHAKILSRLFWPTMSDQGFKLPSPVADQQASYETGFEKLKQSRKLTWLNSIGHVEVELQLEDRTISKEVLPYQASVIYAFHSTSSPRSVSDLSAELDMSPTLVRSACIFWLSQRILMEVSHVTFSVLERLPTHSTSSPTHTHSPTTTSLPPTLPLSDPTATAADAKASEESIRRNKMAMYHPFILAMLTNSGAMPLPRIAMMLGIVVPGGFPFSSEELKEFLGGMVKDGVVEVGMGGNYRVV